MRGLETDRGGSRPPVMDGSWLLWMVILLILGKAFGHVQEVLPPQNVTLTSENGSFFLTWQPRLDFTNNTQYEAEIRSAYGRTSNGSSGWIKVTSCQEKKTRQIQRCDLPLPTSHDTYDTYEARVRARDGARESDWAYSPRLQPRKDTIVGPLDLSLAVTNDCLTVVVSLPPTPDNSSELFHYIQTLKYQLILTEESAELPKNHVLLEEEFQFTGSILNHTYGDLRPSTYYCVKAKAKDQPTKESQKCIQTPDRPADMIVFALVFVVLPILICITAVASFWYLTRRNPSKKPFPKSLTFLNPEPNGNLPSLSPVLRLEEDYIASISVEVLPSKINTALQLIPTGCSAQVWSIYCARGFDTSSSSSSSGFRSSEELAYSTDENYRPAPELTESSAHPSPSSEGRLPHDAGTSYVSQNWECEIDNKDRPRGSSSTSRADVLFSSVKLQTTVDISHTPETYLVRTDSDTPQGTPTQLTIESEEHHEPCGFPKGSHFQDDTSLELRDMKTVTSSGYEFRPAIPFCE